jgi:hypothetical protein
VSREQSQVGSVTVTGLLVRYLRSPVKEELAAIVTVLPVELDNVLDPETYRVALVRFKDGSTLSGVTGNGEPTDIQLDLARWPRLLKTLQSGYDAEAMRLQESAAEERELPLGHLPVLGGPIADVVVGATEPRSHTKRGRHV